MAPSFFSKRFFFKEGRIDRNGQLHDEIDYHDIVTDTEHESVKWDRIQRKAELGSVFREDPGNLDDIGLAEHIAGIKQDRRAGAAQVA